MQLRRAKNQAWMVTVSMIHFQKYYSTRTSCADAGFAALLDMYCEFLPKMAYQGLPPKKPSVAYRWADNLFNSAINILAWDGEDVVGHAVIVADTPMGDSSEIMLFVHQNHRGVGVGSDLLGIIMLEAQCLGVSTLWLSVERSNKMAIRLYRKFGFEFTDYEHAEVVMRLDCSNAVICNP